MPLDCSSCNAACCKSLVDELGIPHHNGVCLFLDQDNKCSIYADRPLICRVDEGFEKFGEGVSKEEWYEKNKEACEELTLQEEERRLKGLKKNVDEER